MQVMNSSDLTLFWDIWDFFCCLLFSVFFIANFLLSVVCTKKWHKDHLKSSLNSLPSKRIVFYTWWTAELNAQGQKFFDRWYIFIAIMYMLPVETGFSLHISIYHDNSVSSEYHTLGWISHLGEFLWKHVMRKLWYLDCTAVHNFFVCIPIYLIFFNLSRWLKYYGFFSGFFQFKKNARFVILVESNVIFFLSYTSLFKRISLNFKN